MALTTRNMLPSILLLLIATSFVIALGSGVESQLVVTTNISTPLAEVRLDYDDELEDIIDPDSPADPQDVAEVVQLFETLRAKLHTDEGDNDESESGRAIQSSHSVNKLKAGGSYVQLEKLLSQAGVDVSTMIKMPLHQSPAPLGFPALPMPSQGPAVAAAGGAPLAPMAGLLTAGLTKMGQQDVEVIKAELRNMLFGDDEPLPTAQKRVQHAQNRQRNEKRPNRERDRDRHRSPSTLLLPPAPARNGPSALVPGIRDIRPGLGANRDIRPQDHQVRNPHVRAPVKEFRPPPPSPFKLPTDNGFIHLDSQLLNSNVRPITRPQSPQFSTDGLLRPPPFGAPTSGTFRPSDPLLRPDAEAFRPVTAHQSPPPRNAGPQLFPLASSHPTSPQSGQNTPQANHNQNPQQNAQHNHNLNSDAVSNGFPIRRPPSPFGSVAVGDCPQYSEGLCLDVRSYPSETILNMLHRNKPVVDAMLAEVRSQSADDLIEGVSSAQERQYNRAHYFGNRRQDGNDQEQRDFASDGGFLCPSEVTYGRPKRALNSKGVWKYIINMGDYTQTLRSPGHSCSYVSPHYQSQCSQVYNYHRLLSWDEQRGLHVDIYKIPTCCSCHIEGYAHSYPPFNRDQGTSATQLVDSKKNVNAPKSTPISSSSPFPQRNLISAKASQSDDTQSFAPSFANGFDTEKIEAFFTEQFADFPTFSQPSQPKRRGDNITELILNSNAEDNPLVSNRERNKVSRKESSAKAKVNYDYHPIIDFFQPYVSNDSNKRSKATK